MVLFKRRAYISAFLSLTAELDVPTTEEGAWLILPVVSGEYTTWRISSTGRFMTRRSR
jgi:hypothetical protein